MAKLIHVKKATIQKLYAGKHLIEVFLPPKSEWQSTKNRSQNSEWVENQKKLFISTGKALLANEENPLQWSTGGLGIIFKDGEDEYLVSIFRDKDAPIYSNHFTIATGLGESEEEYINPILLAREGLEEILIIRSNKLLIPSLNLFGLDIIGIVKGIILNIPDIRNLEIEEVEAKLLDIYDSVVVVYDENNKELSRNNFITFWDPVYSRLDLIRALQYELSINDVVFRDGELVSGNPLNRKIVCIPKNDLHKYPNSTPFMKKFVEEYLKK